MAHQAQGSAALRDIVIAQRRVTSARHHANRLTIRFRQLRDAAFAYHCGVNSTCSSNAFRCIPILEEPGVE